MPIDGGIRSPRCLAMSLIQSTEIGSESTKSLIDFLTWTTDRLISRPEWELT
jgi:hypothetical protein